MNCIVIEDEKPAARKLMRMLEKLNVNVIKTLGSVEESIHWFLNNTHPDILFLDIQLSDGLSFEIFEKVPIKSTIIFTTAYDEYALKAFKLNSIDYLLKPIDEEELKNAVSKYKNIITKLADTSEKLVEFNFEEIKKLLVNPLEREYKNRFSIQVGHQIKMITMDEVSFFYSENKGTYCFTKDRRNYLMNATLETLQQEISPIDFFRINRKYIIHYRAIIKIDAYTNSRLKIRINGYEDQDLIVARERVKEFKSWIG